MQYKKLTATIITLNEERNIARCIDSLFSVADEIVVLDAFSSDRTPEICKSKGVRFEQRKWEGYSASKNYLNSLASHEYIFSVDADEAPDTELQEAIRAEKNKGFEGVYAVNRLTNYCGKWIKHSGWYPDVKVRIFPKSKSTWEGAFVHEELVVKDNPKSKLLSGHLLHYSYYDFKEHRARADKYSALTAQKMHARGKKAGILKPFLSGLGRFVSMYFLKKGFLDGRMGWKIAVISAKSNIFKYKELRRLHNESNP
ncbi:MAG: glycosyltransferase family 2 protein [Brumimicrobium sp.]|nr:glycosyltransferase family 2 protein [Brumimicrobium sp.]